MAWKVLLGACLLVLGSMGALASRPACAEDPVVEEPAADAPGDGTARAIEAWGKTCQKCHAVPDTRFDTDRAFLQQILETT